MALWPEDHEGLRADAREMASTSAIQFTAWSNH
jgi:hypothetical protein